ncbi:fungal-specific transcription factor domain-containing protein [Dendryphion nanum]|uniref:Fungal-specific transcription factor domain-containing protein n=1 Tax=Dendryphion nanum TaxID=256645 RepID=A0A9P9DTY6_9PLEO|nr:fungal-specific transcription factor domain-containing protein [Dendryphion nanum]
MDNDNSGCKGVAPTPEAERSTKRRRTSTYRPTREVGLMRSIPGDKFSTFVGSASGVYFIRSVYGAIRRSNPITSANIQTPESDIVPGEDDHLPSAVPDTSGHLWKDGEIDANYSGTPSFHDLVEWSGSYFANWHPAYPFLHAPAILEYLEKLTRDGVLPISTSQDLDAIILRSIMSISLADRRQATTPEHIRYPTELIFLSYESAVDSLQSVLSRPTSILSLQAAISVQLFLVSMLRLNAASRLGGLVIRMALQLGLHRCPSRYPSFSTHQREFRQRIFWTLYSIDRFICQSMGLPLGMHDDDIDVCYPTGERHTSAEQQSDDRLRLLTLLARHSEIRGLIMELRNKSIRYIQKSTDQATVINGKLAQWWNDVEGFLDSDCDEFLSPYFITVLTVLKHESIIALNRPILASSREDPSYNSALQNCIGSARSIITTLHQAIKPDLNPHRSSAPMSLLWHSCTWAIWMSTFVLFHAANTKEVTQHVASRLAVRSLEVLDHLSRRGSVWPSACATAIRDLRNQMMKSAQNPTGNINPKSSMSTLDGMEHQAPISNITQPEPNGSESVADSSTSPHVIEHRFDRSAAATAPSLNSNMPRTAQSSVNSHSKDLGVRGIVNSKEPILSESPNGSGPSLHPHNTVTLDQSETNAEAAQWNDFMRTGATFDQSMTLGGGEGLDPFSGFDIPFWLGQDQYWGMVNDWH